MRDFKQELTALLNAHSKENDSQTPDFLLAEYLLRCLDNWNVTIGERERWYHRDTAPTEPPPVPPNEEEKAVLDRLIELEEQRGDLFPNGFGGGVVANASRKAAKRAKITFNVKDSDGWDLIVSELGLSEEVQKKYFVFGTATVEIEVNGNLDIVGGRLIPKR